MRVDLVEGKEMKNNVSDQNLEQRNRRRIQQRGGKRETEAKRKEESSYFKHTTVPIKHGAESVH